MRDEIAGFADGDLDIAEIADLQVKHGQSAIARALLPACGVTFQATWKIGHMAA